MEPPYEWYISDKTNIQSCPKNNPPTLKKKSGRKCHSPQFSRAKSLDNAIACASSSALTSAMSYFAYTMVDSVKSSE